MTATEWPSIHNGPLWTRLRRRLFGLNDAEILTRRTLFARMQEDIRREIEQDDREFDEWWEREGKNL